MLPFLMQKKVPSAIISSRRKPDEDKMNPEDPNEYNQALQAAAEDILRAIRNDDSRHLAAALQAAHDICESSEPTEEEDKEDRPDPHSFESQNIKAAQERE